MNTVSFMHYIYLFYIHPPCYGNNIAMATAPTQGTRLLCFRPLIFTPIKTFCIFFLLSGRWCLHNFNVICVIKLLIGLAEKEFPPRLSVMWTLSEMHFQLFIISYNLKVGMWASIMYHYSGVTVWGRGEERDCTTVDHIPWEIEIITMDNPRMLFS